MIILVAIGFVVWALWNARSTTRAIFLGEAHFIVSRSGDGLLGHAERADNPLGFWAAIMFNFTLSIAALSFAIYLLFLG